MLVGVKNNKIPCKTLLHTGLQITMIHRKIDASIPSHKVRVTQADGPDILNSKLLDDKVQKEKEN
jgi:hypothetical protein